MSDCCLTPTRQFFSCIMAQSVRDYIDVNEHGRLRLSNIVYFDNLIGMSYCCLTPSVHFSSHIMTRTSHVYTPITRLDVCWHRIVCLFPRFTLSYHWQTLLCDMWERTKYDPLYIIYLIKCNVVINCILCLWPNSIIVIQHKTISSVIFKQ